MQTLKLAALAVALASAATLVHAGDEGDSRFFVNANAGGTHSFLDNLTTKNDVGYAISGGYRWQDTWGFEVGYVDLGKTKANNIYTGDYYGLYNIDLKVRGATVGANFKFDFARNWYITAHGGAFISQSKFHEQNVYLENVSARDEAHNVNAYAGAGIGYNINEHVGIGLNVDSYLARARGFIRGTNSIVMYTGSVEVRF
jgi:OOP family OmpA-OmpF porin/outer membrane immunogenic protein